MTERPAGTPSNIDTGKQLSERERYDQMVLSISRGFFQGIEAPTDQERLVLANGVKFLAGFCVRYPESMLEKLGASSYEELFDRTLRTMSEEWARVRYGIPLVKDGVWGYQLTFDERAATEFVTTTASCLKELQSVATEYDVLQRAKAPVPTREQLMAKAAATKPSEE